MAQGTNWAPFPDPERPLYTPDENAQRQVVARIAQARRGNGKRKRKRKNEPTYPPDEIVLELRKPMDQHRIIGRDELCAGLGVGKDKAKHLVEHPEDMDRDTTHALCELLGVTIEWLRGWDAENGFQRYDSPESVAEVYRHLPTKDKELVCRLLHRLSDPDTVESVWLDEISYWMKHSPGQL